MSSSEARRLASLPGYDTAPDIYETPDLTDDTSTTTRPTSPRSGSPSVSSLPSSDDDDDDDNHIDGLQRGGNKSTRAGPQTANAANKSRGETRAGHGNHDDRHGISRRRLFPDRARTKFAATAGRVDATRVDLSDRVDGKRRGYNLSKSRRGRNRDGRDDREGGGGEEDEAEQNESLEGRIARLKREIEECRNEAMTLNGGPSNGGGDGRREREEEGDEGKAVVDEIDDLGRLLKDVSRLTSTRKHDRVEARNGQDQTQTSTTDELALRKVVDFDSRLTSLESILGITSLDSTSSDALTIPVLPSLVALDQQLNALSTAASLASLEAASARLDKLKRQAIELSSSLSGAEDDSAVTNQTLPNPTISPEDTKQLHSLYSLIPNLRSLAPTVPAILERLRSLRTLHASAATAASDLEEIEKQQDEMDKDLVVWRDGLAKIEAAVRQASEANGKNGMVVEGWVKDLEDRVHNLSR